METMQLVYDAHNFNEVWLQDFPSTVKLDQAVAAWKHIVDCSEREGVAS